jgi:heme/copper-type cytochrome/quinol oxidase subunit 4
MDPFVTVSFCNEQIVLHLGYFCFMKNEKKRCSTSFSSRAFNIQFRVILLLLVSFLEHKDQNMQMQFCIGVEHDIILRRLYMNRLLR